MGRRVQGAVAIRLTAAAVLLSCGLAATAAASDAGPRPVSPAEAAAVEIVADFLARGPVAFQERLADDSGFSAIRANDALAEIEARTGPPAGSRWTLETVAPSLADRVAVFDVEFASGIDDVVEVELVEREGRHLVLGLRSHAEPSAWAIHPPWRERGDGAFAAEPPKMRRFVLPGLLILAFSVLVLTAMRMSVAAGRLSGIVSLAVCCGLLWLVARDAGDRLRRTEPDGGVEAGIERLGGLLELRRAIASGDRRVVEIGSSGQDVAAIWEAQVLMQVGRPADAWKALERFPLDCDRPMVQLLRARIAAGAREVVTSSRAYERAMRLGPGRDGLWLESAEWSRAGGLDERAEARLKRLPDIGSRDSRAYYALATLALAGRKPADASSLTATAWRLDPLPRAEMLARPALSALLAIDDVSALVSLSAPREPKFRAGGDEGSAIVLPPGADATVTGSLLVVGVGQSELIVPGGARLVPESGAAILDAVERKERESSRRLADLESLVDGFSVAALAQPSFRERAMRTAEALAENGRWEDVERMTMSLQPDEDGVPLDLLLLRGVALFRLGRIDDARRFATGLSAGPAVRRGISPAGASQLGELLAALELYDPAIRMLELADAMMEGVSLDDRIRQLSMNRRLASDYGVHESPNFVIHHPRDVSVAQMRSLASVLEAELARLRSRIPLESFRRTTVNVLWWSEFRSTYTFSDHILGFYDGRLTLPLAGVDVRAPEVVAIVTHELAHAVIAQATSDRAPAWLHEGLAQRMEMVPRQPSAFGMYTEDRMLPIVLIDPVLRYAVDPERLSQAYVTSQTLVRFIESRYGERAIADLVRAIRERGDAGAALRSVTGVAEADLEIAFRAWGRSRIHGFENVEIRRYDAEPSEAGGRGGLRWSAGGKP